MLNNTLFDRLKNKEQYTKNKLVNINPVQNTTAQAQPTTLYGSLTSNNNSNSFDNTNNKTMNSIQGIIGNGANGAQSYASGGGTPWGAIAGVGKNTYNLISNKTPGEYSDTEQSVIYPLQGAATGSQFGPWGAAAGALYGLGYSLRDELGLKDSNFFSQLLHPIGMGDGGGLRINGKSVLDIG